MSSVKSLAKKDLTTQHKNELKRLSSEHSNAIEKLKLKHQNLKQQLRFQQQQEKAQLHNEHQRDLAKQVKQNEQTYTKLKNSLESVKETVAKEKENIQAQKEKRIQDIKLNFEDKAQKQKLKNELKIQDMDHQAQIQLEKLQRRIRQKEQAVKTESNANMAQLRSTKASKFETEKALFDKQQIAQENKFQMALINQRKTNNDQLVAEERKHQKKIKTRQDIYKDQTEKISTTYNKKINNLKQSQEEKYSQTFKKNEAYLQKLLKNKEQIVNRVREMLKTQAKKEIDLNEDPFYHHTKLAPKVEMNEEQNGYRIQLEIPPREADHVNLVGQQRELRLSLDRNYDFTTQNDTGTKQTVKKAETYTTKIPVEYIVDPKTIEKTYADGILTYNIKFA
ncbi:MAG: hypothetical protein QF441_09905 [Bacteriovoracaceae bacterium]|jgi:HSP20 family molecular chaperone IbpA|nr:hypothetical protein [Bacteriovoracaceae bacterium]